MTPEEEVTVELGNWWSFHAARVESTDVWVSECDGCRFGSTARQYPARYFTDPMPSGIYCLNCDYGRLFGNDRCVARTQNGSRCARTPAENRQLCSHHRRNIDQSVEAIVGEWYYKARQDALAAAERVRELYATAEAEALTPTTPPSVYFLYAGGYVKVGTARDVQSRVASLLRPSDTTARPADLDLTDGRLLGTIPGGHLVERSLHTRYAPDRIRGTEWFAFTHDVRDDIAVTLGVEPDDWPTPATAASTRRVSERLARTRAS